jgi:uncharacterized protein
MEARLPGEMNLTALLAGMRPRLQPDVLVFCTIDARSMPATLNPIMTFREAEGATLILPEQEAHSAKLPASFRCRMITLEIHSSLEAVGFLAAIAARLAASGISVNAVSAFHHDHLFVPVDRAEEAMGVLEEMVAESAGDANFL